MGGKDKNGGAGAQTQTKEPWAAAQPWITNNMQRGQALQNQLTAQPFSAQQEQAYNNSYAQSDYMRSLVPSLLGQMQNQQVGFDRTGAQPNKQNAWNWAGLMGEGSPNIGGGSGTMQAAAQLQAELDAARKANKGGDFKQMNAADFPMAGYYGAYMGMGNQMTDGGAGIKSAFQSALGDAGGAGYGEFKYGQPMPEKGTKAYRDMQEYKQYGGNDPFNLYGWGATRESMLDPRSEFYDINLANEQRLKTQQGGGA
jgi:hypothetical protein